MYYNWNDSILQKIHQKIDDIATILIDQKEVEESSLLGGKCGIALTLFLYHEYAEVDNAHERATELLNEVLEELQSGRLSISFSNGLSGVGWALNFLVQKDFIDEEIEELLVSIDELLLEQIHQMKNNDSFYFDYLHGALGLLLYFSERPSNAAVEASQALVALLEKHAIEDENGGCTWISTNTLTGKSSYNLSLSHGMASIIAILTKLLEQKRFQNDAIKSLLTKTCQYVMNQKHGEPCRVFFPDMIDIKSGEPTDPKHARLAWCYGDLGTAYSLLKAARVLGDHLLEKEALYVLKKSTERTDCKANKVVDAGLCHGAFGIAFVYHNLYESEKLPCFRTAVEHWIKTGLTMDTHKDGLAGYKRYFVDSWKLDYGFIEGISGVLLTLLTAVDFKSKTTREWESCLLL